jgi:non-ribosomal peptide synthase protein (TIGR01720 family)
LDRRALPEPDYALREVDNEYVAPRSLIEQKLAAIWSKILKIENIGIHDNFFNIGGDSIISIQVVSRARAEGIHFSVKDVFSHPTIAGLATVAESSRTEATLKPDQELTRGEVPLTPIQEWFFKRDLVEYHYFNQAILLQVSEKLDMPLLRQAFRLLVTHHDALRYRYKKRESSWVQYCADEGSFSLDEIDLSHSENLEVDIERTCASIQKSLNINQGPLVKAALIDCGKTKPQRLFIVIHHLVIDGVSWGILIEDLEKIYSALASKKLPTFPPKSHSYQQWSHALQIYAQSKQIEDEMAYWENIDKKIAQLPQDFNRGKARSAETQRVRVSLNKTETTNLLQKVPEAYRTQINDILLASLALSSGDWTQDYRVSLYLEGHGREDIIEEMDLSRTIGWFTSIFPVNLKISAPDDIGEAIKEVKETLRQIPHKGIGYGILRYLKKSAFSSYPSLSFNYLGQRDKITSSSSKFVHAKESYGATTGGENAPSHHLIVNGRIQDDVLQVDFFYSPNHYQKQTIQKLAQNYEKRLKQIIDHCSDKNNYGYTPSDFTLSGLGKEKLSELLESIERG